MRTFSRTPLILVIPLLGGCGQVVTARTGAEAEWSAPKAQKPKATQGGKYRGKIEARLSGVSVPIPSAADIVARVRREHPRLVPEGHFEELRRRVETDAELGAWYAEIKQRALKIATSPPVRAGQAKSLRAVTSTVLERVLTLGLVYQIEGEQRVLDRLLEEVRVAGQLRDWNPSKFLETSEMALALGIAYDWNHDDLAPKQRELIRGALVQKALKPAQDCFQGRSQNGLWVVRDDNWNTVCNGGIGVAALAVATEEPEVAGSILNSALRSIQLSMVKFAPDGGWEEGPGYLAYASLYDVAFLAALEGALGTDYGLSEMAGVESSGEFALYLTSPAGLTFNYADSTSRISDQPHLFWLASRFDRPELAWYAARYGEAHPFAVLWSGAEVGARLSKPPPLDRLFKRVEVATFRSGWEDPEALFLGFKAGDNAANHAHLDLGSFVLDALGERWALDLGADAYGLPGYFDVKGRRWGYYRMRAEGHNTLVLNPDKGPGQDPAAAAEIVRFETTPRRAFAIADLTAAYGEQADSLRRGVLVLDRERVLVQDELEADRPTDFRWFLHTEADVEVSGGVATLKSGDARLEARILTPESARFEVLAAAPMPDSPAPKGQDENRGVRKLGIRIENARKLRLAVLLTPYRGDAPTASPPKVEPLKRW